MLVLGSYCKGAVSSWGKTSSWVQVQGFFLFCFVFCSFLLSLAFFFICSSHIHFPSASPYIAVLGSSYDWSDL